MLINRDGAAIDDPWTYFSDDQQLTEDVDLIFNAEALEILSDKIAVARKRIGLWVPSHFTDQSIANWIDRVDLIALDFPKFADGRAYSTARLLRTRHGFEGEIRATGNVLTDQLDYMARCGFDAFELDRERTSETLQTALTEMRYAYQSSASDVTLIWKKRHSIQNGAS